MNSKDRDRVIGRVEIRSEMMKIVVSRYLRGRQPYVGLESEASGEPCGHFSTNLAASGVALGEQEFAVKTWSENEELMAPMMATGLFEDTGRRERAGFAEAQIWRFRSSEHVPAL